ncbi:TetR family transcriptional regulator [Cellulomonas soli]
MGVEPAVSSTSAADEAVEVVRPRGRRPVGQDTRGLILEAARVEFAERGFAAASVRAVARRAGWTRRWCGTTSRTRVSCTRPD